MWSGKISVLQEKFIVTIIRDVLHLKKHLLKKLYAKKTK